MKASKSLPQKWDVVGPCFGDRSYNRYLRVCKFFIKHHNRANSLIIDLGCGEGRSLEVFAKLGFNNLFGIDISFVQLKATQKRVNSSFIIQASLTHLPFRTGFFDIAVSTMTIEHIKDPMLAISEMARVVRKFGSIVITTRGYFSWQLANRILKYNILCPVDKCIFPTRLLSMLRENNLMLLAMDAWGNILKTTILESVSAILRRILPKNTFHALKDRFYIYRKVRDITVESVTPYQEKASGLCLMKSLFFHEYAFYLRKA